MCHQNIFVHSCGHEIRSPIHRCDRAGKDVFPNPHCYRYPKLDVRRKDLPQECPGCTKARAQREVEMCAREQTMQARGQDEHKTKGPSGGERRTPGRITAADAPPREHIDGGLTPSNPAAPTPSIPEQQPANDDPERGPDHAPGTMYDVPLDDPRSDSEDYDFCYEDTATESSSASTAIPSRAGSQADEPLGGDNYEMVESTDVPPAETLPTPRGGILAKLGLRW